jgi:catechol 2,3-dioxygenase-like lactoylglutathione lyase family enzyme
VITGINHTGIVVADLEEAIAFYTDVLGLELVERRERDGGPISQVLDYQDTHIKVADVAAPDGRVIELIHYLNPPPADRPTEDRSVLGASHTAFSVDDMAATFSRLTDGGARRLNPPVEVAPGKLVCYLQDPWGNWLELIQQASR